MRLLGAGDNVADRYLDLGILFPGGNAVNVAVFAARLGAHAAYLGVVGDDEAASHLVRALQAEHVDTSLVRVGHGPNATADVTLSGTDRVFLRSDRTTATFELDPGQLESMHAFDVVHSGYAGTLLERVPEIAERTKVSFDFGSRFDLDAVLPVLGHLHLAAFSGSHLSRSEAESLVRTAKGAGASYVLVTRGEDGAYFGAGSDIHHQEADRVPAVDTLGAGDAYIASVLVGLSTGGDARAILTDASAHAARVCQAHGAFGHGLVFAPSPIGRVAPDETSTTNGVKP